MKLLKLAIQLKAIAKAPSPADAVTMHLKIVLNR